MQAFQWLMARWGPQNAPDHHCSGRPANMLQTTCSGKFCIIWSKPASLSFLPPAITKPLGRAARQLPTFGRGAVQKKGIRIEIAVFSSRGPVQWENELSQTGNYGTGVNIRSALAQGWLYYFRWHLLAAACFRAAALLRNPPAAFPLKWARS